MNNDLTLIFSLISLGFFGGFSHCIGMCGPFVLTQVTNRLQTTPIEKFTNFEKLTSFALLPYHLGRITTYSFLGFLCSSLAQNIEDITQFRELAAVLMIFAALFFLNILFNEKLFKLFTNSKLRFKSRLIKIVTSFFVKRFGFLNLILKNLFESPRGFNGFLLGIILGFIPCGLLYGAFLITATISQPTLGALGMVLFGFATFPSLFLAGSSGYVLLKFPEFKIIIKLVVAINVIMLVLMAIKLIVI